MIIRCANCQTEFSLDDRQVGPEGAAVRCSVCNYVFRVEPPSGGLSDQPWQIRTMDDLLFTAPDLTTLRSWIAEGRLHPDDFVSRTGRHWLRLGDMPEFSDAFRGFQGLPKVVQPLGGAPSERSAVDELGPPPEFGTSEVSSPGMSPQLATSPVALDIPAELEENLAVVLGERPLTAAEEVRRPAGTPSSAPPPRRPRPASMLDAVTKHVRPITQPAVEVRRAVPPPPPGITAPPAAVEPEPEPEASASVESAFAASRTAAFAEPTRRRSWPVYAALAAIAGVAVVFGIPQVRSAIFGGDPPPDVPAQPAVLADADQALQALEPARMAKAEAALQAEIDEGGQAPPQRAAMQLAQVELLTARALELRIGAATAAQGSDHSETDAAHYVARAQEIFGAIATDQIGDKNRLKRVRAQLRLSQGRDENEILGLLPDTEAADLKWVVQAAALWQVADGQVPPKVLDGLASVESPTTLGRLVLAQGQLRAGDEAAARQTARALLDVSPGQPTAQAIVRGGGARPSSTGTGGAEAGATDGAGSTGSGGTIVIDEPPPTPPPTPSGSAGGEGGRAPTPTASADSLIDRGCKKVERGDAKAGIKLLQRAFDLRPGDVDVALCLAKGHAKLGTHATALRFYERVLARSPRLGSAVAGAATSAAKIGRTRKAIKYYERLLELEPGNAAAKRYLDANKKSGDESKSG